MNILQFNVRLAEGGAAAICAVVALALVLVCGYIGMDSRKVLHRDLERLRKIGGKH